MAQFTQFEILKLDESGFDKLIIGKTLRFETNSKDHNKGHIFNALVLDLTLSSEGKPFSLRLVICGESEEKELYILKIKSIKSFL